LGAHFIAFSPGTKTIFTPLHHIVRQYHSIFTQCLHFTTCCTTAFTTGCRQQVAVYTDLYKNRTIVGKNDKMIRLQIDAVMLRVGGLGDGGGGNRPPPPSVPLVELRYSYFSYICKTAPVCYISCDLETTLVNMRRNYKICALVIFIVISSVIVINMWNTFFACIC